MATYYDVTLAAAVPQGSDVLDKPCTVRFSYPEGSSSHRYDATVFAWPVSKVLRIRSPTLNIEAAWAGANAGTLDVASGTFSFAIVGFAKV